MYATWFVTLKALFSGPSLPFDMGKGSIQNSYKQTQTLQISHIFIHLLLRGYIIVIHHSIFMPTMMENMLLQTYGTGVWHSAKWEGVARDSLYLFLHSCIQCIILQWTGQWQVPSGNCDKKVHANRRSQG